MIVDWLDVLTLYACGDIAMHFTLHVHESRLYARLSFHSGASLLALSKDVHGHGLPSSLGETADKGTSRIKVGVLVAGQASVVLSSLSLSLKSSMALLS